MRTLTALLTLCFAASGQSMLESGAVLAGTTVGSAAGKKVSEGINASLKRTGSVLEKAAKTGPRAAPAVPSAPATPLLRVSAGVPMPEPNNVPPPPPRRAAIVAKPVKQRALSAPIVMSAVVPAVQSPFAAPVNVDLAGIQQGMFRDSVLSLGVPSARITMYDDGHVIEIYQYRNASLPSGTVRLRDGSVSAIEARP